MSIEFICEVAFSIAVTKLLEKCRVENDLSPQYVPIPKLIPFN